MSAPWRAGESAVLANVPAATSSTQLFAANTGARIRIVDNDSTATLYLKYGSAASATSYTAKVAPGGHYEFPTAGDSGCYSGLVHGLWTAVNGAARVTEVS